ncbi:MAG: BolA family protein [Pseudomonadota bacterium]
MSMDERIEEKLRASFAPTSLEVLNESHLHSGHHGSPGTGESHYRVRIVAEVFRGRSRIEQHRLVNAALAEELAGGVHALAIKASAPADPEHAR